MKDFCHFVVFLVVYGKKPKRLSPYNWPPVAGDEARTFVFSSQQGGAATQKDFFLGRSSDLWSEFFTYLSESF
jgi:hypothetical protein